VRTVAHNEFGRHCRAATRETSLEAASERAEWLAGISVAVALERQEDTREVLAAVISGLPPKQREVMAWCWDGFSDGEIAAQLGDSAAAVRKNRSRAMKNLRRLLAQAGGMRSEQAMAARR
jgi:RNA polymerase sigma factor (sigma-70 family)